MFLILFSLCLPTALFSFGLVAEVRGCEPQVPSMILSFILYFCHFKMCCSNSSWTYSASAMFSLYFWESSTVALDKTITRLVSRLLLLCPDIYKLCITAVVSVLLLVLKLVIYPTSGFLNGCLRSQQSHIAHTFWAPASCAYTLSNIFIKLSALWTLEKV